MTWEEAFSRLDGVRDELQAAKFALARVERALEVGEDPIPAASPIRPNHVRRCSRNAEITYVLRLFAEFESVLRDYWNVARPTNRRRRTRMEILMDRIAVVRNIPWEYLQAAYRVREYRNAAIHDEDGVDVLTFQECESRLGKFMSYLPVRW